MAVNKENSCAFYVSDYHLEMIMLPYINENLKQNKSVYVFTQNNLEDTINTLVEKVNLKNEIKDNILNINWKVDDENKYNKIIEDKKEKIIIIKGNEKYIETINKNINQIKQYQPINVVDCYNLQEIGNNANIISKNYKNILTTLKINN